MSHKRTHTVSGTHTHTHTFCGSMRIARELPAVRDLWGNRTPPVPLSSPREPRETLSPTGASASYSLIPRLMAACPLFSLPQFIPVFVVPPHLSFCAFWSQSTRFHAIILHHIKARPTGANVIPAALAAMRPAEAGMWGTVDSLARCSCCCWCS